MFFSLTLPNIYIISLMASLNSRQGWKYTRDPQTDPSNMSNVHLAGGENRPRASARTVYTHKVRHNAVTAY